MDEVETVALAAALLFRHGQTTQGTVDAAQQLGRTLGVPLRVLPHWDELVVEFDHTTFSEIVPAAPLGVHMGKVMAVQTVIDQVRGGTMSNAVGMLAHAARWALISILNANVATAAFFACLLVGLIVSPIVDRLRLPFAAVGFSAVVSMMPGFFLFRAASTLLELVAIGPRASANLVPAIVANGGTAFLIVLAMTVGLVLPRMLFRRFVKAARPFD
jgi:uncharacterized membrane protein YjjB (DUF3815 family)